MKYVKGFIIRLMICVLIALGTLIVVRKNSNFKSTLYKEVYDNNISFGYINSLYQKYLGNIIPFKLDMNTTPVFSETLKYNSSNKYLNGCSLSLENKLVPSLDAGLIIFIGEKEGYGNTIIVEQENGVEVWYGNIDNINVKLYDYINKGIYLGNTKDDNLYLVFIKDGNYLDYEDYI